MACSYGIVYPLWSFADDRGAELERIIGETGIDSVSVPLVTGEVTEFRFEPVKPPHWFHTNGGWHYEFERKRYESLALKPAAAEWVGKRHVLKEMMEFAGKRGVAVGFEFDFQEALRAVPEGARAARRTFHGEADPGGGACPLHPDAAELIAQTLEEVRSWGPAMIHWAFWPLVPNAVEIQYALGSSHSLLLRAFGDCYCVGCRAIASSASRTLDLAVGVDLLRRTLVELKCHQSVSEGDAATMDQFLSAYRALRIEAYRERQRAWRFGFGEGAFRIAAGTPDEAAAAGAAEIGAVPRLSWRQWDEPNDGALERWMEQLRKLGAKRWAFNVELGRAAPEGAAELVSLVSRLGEFAPLSIDFARIDCEPRRVVGWVKQALRFARRSETL